MGTWLILFLVGRPSERSLVNSLSADLGYFLSADNPNEGWFIGWAALPVALLLLAIACARLKAQPWVSASRLMGAGIAMCMISLWLWPAVLVPCAVGVFFINRARGQ